MPEQPCMQLCNKCLVFHGTSQSGNMLCNHAECPTSQILVANLARHFQMYSLKHHCTHYHTSSLQIDTQCKCRLPLHRCTFQSLCVGPRCIVSKTTAHIITNCCCRLPPSASVSGHQDGHCQNMHSSNRTADYACVSQREGQG